VTHIPTTLRAHLRSNLVAYAAMFVALGGTSYAATELAASSVGPRELKRNAVTAAKIRPDAIRSAKVKDGSLLAKDFGPGQLPAGLRGPEGPKGDTGSAGPGFSGIQRVHAGSAPGSGTEQQATALCPEGKRAFAGGASIEAPAGAPIALQETGSGGASSYPAPGWFVAAREMASYAGDWKVHTWAYCAAF
jgi:hypothetical protein